MKSICKKCCGIGLKLGYGSYRSLVFVCESMLRRSFYRCRGNIDVPVRIGLKISLGSHDACNRDNETAAAAMGKDVVRRT